MRTLSLLSLPTLGTSVAAITALVAYLLQRRKYAKSIIRQLDLESFTTYLARGIGYRMARHLRPRAAARLSLRDFAINRLAASDNTVHVPAAVPQKLSLDQMFVPLTALSSEQTRISATQVAFGADYHRVLLVGDPGSGKSTLVKRIYRDICRDAVANGNRGRIPVLIELKNLDRYPDNLADAIRAEVTSVNTYSGDDLYTSFLGDGRITVLLDGLDEVRTSEFDTVSEKIVALCDHLARAHARNQVIVTTRRQLYVNLAEEFTSEFEAHLTLEPFTPDDMYEFLRKWPYHQNPEAQLARIFGNLSSQANIRSMCQTPLILAMYVATDQLTGGEGLPETRPDFYRAVTDELLVRRRSRQHGLTTGLNVLRRTRQAIIGRLALEHLMDATQPRNNLRWDAALKIIEEEEGLTPDAAGRRLRELSRDTGLFTEERKEESLRFIHLTFCEFLAAQQIIHGPPESWDRLTDLVEYGRHDIESTRWVDRLSEVIIFAIALEKNKRTRRARARWVIQIDNTELTLRAWLDAQPYEDKVVLNHLDSIANSIAATPSIARDENWLHLFRLVAMILRDQELVEQSVTGTKRALLAPYFARITGPDSGARGELFLSYLRLDPAGALELAHSMKLETTPEYAQLLIKALDEPVVLTYALAQFTSGEQGARTWASILALGALSHRSVNRKLATMRVKVGGDLDQWLNSIGRRRGWHRCWATRGTMLGAVLEASCRWPSESTFLAVLATTSIPRSKFAELLSFLEVKDWIWIATLPPITLVALQQYNIAGTPTWPGALFIYSLLVGRKLFSENRILELNGTRALLRPGLTAHPDRTQPAIAVAIKENPTIGHAEFVSAWRAEYHEPPAAGWRGHLRRHLPIFLLWYPGYRMVIANHTKDYLPPTEAG